MKNSFIPAIIACGVLAACSQSSNNKAEAPSKRNQEEKELQNEEYKRDSLKSKVPEGDYSNHQKSHKHDHKH